MKITVIIKVEPSIFGDPEEEAAGSFICEVKSRESTRILSEVTASLKPRLKTVVERINEQEEARNARANESSPDTSGK